MHNRSIRCSPTSRPQDRAGAGVVPVTPHPPILWAGDPATQVAHRPPTRRRGCRDRHAGRRTRRRLVAARRPGGGRRARAVARERAGRALPRDHGAGWHPAAAPGGDRGRGVRPLADAWREPRARRRARTTSGSAGRGQPRASWQHPTPTRPRQAEPVAAGDRSPTPGYSTARLSTAERAALDVTIRKAEQLCRAEFSVFVGRADRRTARVRDQPAQHAGRSGTQHLDHGRPRPARRRGRHRRRTYAAPWAMPRSTWPSPP